MEETDARGCLLGFSCWSLVATGLLRVCWVRVRRGSLKCSCGYLLSESLVLEFVVAESLVWSLLWLSTIIALRGVSERDVVKDIHNRARPRV